MLLQLCCLLACFVGVGQNAPAKDLRSKDFELRKAALAALVQAPDKATGKLLVGVLDDADGEIVELAALGLGSIGFELAGKQAVKALAKVALEAPIRRVRLAASTALRELDPESAQSLLQKKLSGDNAASAGEALALVLQAVTAPAEDKPLKKALSKAVTKSKDYSGRVAAARALMIVAADNRGSVLAELLEHEALGVRAAALEAVLEGPTEADLEPVRDLLLQGALSDVIERRALGAVKAALWMQADGQRDKLTKELIEGLLRASAVDVARRAPRLIERLAGVESPYALEDLLAWLDPALESEHPEVRSAAAHALGVLAQSGSPKALELARERAALDPDAGVRRAAIRAVVGVLQAADADTDDETGAKRRATLGEWCAERLGLESDARAREDLAVALGFKDNAAALPALVAALEDPEIWVRVCAAVSIGKTRLEAGVEPLSALLEHEDWKLRGAGVVGLGTLYQAAAVPTLIAAVGDSDPVVAQSAHGFLEVFSRLGEAEPSVEAWEAWWQENAASLKVVDPESAEQRADKYGYSKDWERIYGGLDVVVLESRGDHIEHVLTKLEIEHRLTQAAKITAGVVRPTSVFVANCTGELEEPDVERLAWFVRSGGYLIGSCWALTETIGRVYPGVLAQHKTKGEVLDTVGAAVCVGDSPYVEGVFEPGVLPLYSLVGAHLIAVLEPELAEVLIDSPECAERWGEGNLCAWFPAGHGVVLDSANHFEEQGLLNAQGLKTPEDRQAYAVNHMGLSWAELREMRKQDFWSSNAKAAREILDLSIFRLVTNFVRAKRIGG